MSQELVDIADRVEACFSEIERTRMDGVPILNKELRVRTVGMQDWAGGALCVLVTPWFMNLMLFSSPDVEAQESARVGDKRSFAFPAGQFEFIRGSEESLGGYWMCSLFSPVFEFADHETAELAAAAALHELMNSEEQVSEQEAEMEMIWRGEKPQPEATVGGEEAPEESAPEPEAPIAKEVSRRNLLRGNFRESEQ